MGLNESFDLMDYFLSLFVAYIVVYCDPVVVEGLERLVHLNVLLVEVGNQSFGLDTFNSKEYHVSM